MSEGTGHWRWNSNITWHYYCSVCSSAALYHEVSNSFMKYHHLRTQIYFSVCTLESFLNSEMRRFQHAAGKDEEVTYKLLRYTRLERKLNNWPSLILQRQFSFDDDFWQFFDSYKAARDEITHPKARDHSIYVALEAASPEAIRSAVALAIVKFYEASDKPWPYWLTGWNYVGMNGNPSWPFEATNLSGFYWSLIAFGFPGLGSQMDFERRFMLSRDHFKEIAGFLDSFKVDIEPFSPQLPTRPRLTRRWWDQQYLIDEYQENMRTAGQQR